MKPVDQRRPVEVVSIRPELVLPDAPQEERVIFDQKLDEMLRVSDSTMKAVDAMTVKLEAAMAALRNRVRRPAWPAGRRR